MCGISGIVYNLEDKYADFDFNLCISFANTLKSIEPGVNSLNKLSSCLEEIEPFTDKLFDFSNFYQIYNSESNRNKVENFLEAVSNKEDALDKYLKGLGVSLSVDLIEKFNSLLIRFKDISWRIREDLLKNISKIKDNSLNANRKFIQELWKLNFILNNLDRLEVRGRDSAGLSCLVTFPGPKDLKDFKEKLESKEKENYYKRVNLYDFVHNSIIETSDNKSEEPLSLLFTFKVAEEIGKLGDNVSTLRNFIKSDEIFLKALSSDTKTNFFTHTRWASNGIINEQNCHPVNNETYFIKEKQENKNYSISAVLNGDIDNFQELKDSYTGETGKVISGISGNITTDAKIIPVIVEKYYEEKKDLLEAFRTALNEFKGSMAITMHSSLEPEKIYLALRGSGQALFIGLINRGYVFASELYGVVEESSRFIKIEGDRERVPGDPSTQGQIFVLDQSLSGGLKNLKAYYFDGVEIDLKEEHLKKAEITTRDINRGNYPHFLLKEISESPLSIEKTLRGKFEIKETPGGPCAVFNIGNEIIPKIILNKIKEGDIKKIYIIGQGTASIAGNGIANFMSRVLSKTGIQIISTKATELSGFFLEDDMSHVLAIAVSQSGTTTDTNRTVDMLKGRGAHTVAIVNRRNSDLVYKSDGVFYTSDGRDIEMSVASTKAFYSQVVSGSVISLYFAQILSTLKPEEIVRELRELINLPEKMYTILENKDHIRKVAEEFAVTRKYWAVVGSGPNKVSADEIRIKLSELCYKSIATDTTEDKKHIDLSSEPLIIACVSGVKGSTLHDMVKEVAIFKAHKACPIVIVTEEDKELFSPYASGLLLAPGASEDMSMLFNTMVGHLWGYYAAKAIDDSSAVLKKIRSITVDALVNSSRINLYRHKRIIGDFYNKIHSIYYDFYSKVKKDRYNSCLEVKTASQLTLLFKFIQGKLPIEDFEFDFGAEGTISSVLNETVSTLSSAIAELTRPIDAIKHQAKTVTVGISRLEDIPEGIIFDRLKEENISFNSITYQNNFILQSVSTAVENIKGTTRYGIYELDPMGSPSDKTMIKTLSKSGIASSMSSRADEGTLLIGRKKSVVARNRIFAGKGNIDSKSIVIIPVMKKGVCGELVLFQLDFKEDLSPDSKVNLVRALDKYDDIKYVVTETNTIWEDELLNNVSVIDLIGEDPDDIAKTIVEAVD